MHRHARVLVRMSCLLSGEWFSAREDPAPQPQCNERLLFPSHTRNILPKLLRC